MSVPSWSDKLTPEQVVAASHYGSHARLLAGPGTGKTHTLARRVVFLATEKQVDPANILVLTFTRMATRQLRSTIKNELSPYTQDMPYISTLHGFSLRQLRRNSKLVQTLPQPLRIADDWEENEIIAEDMKQLLNRPLKAIREGFRELSADWQTLQADAENWKETLPDAPFVGMWEEHRTIYGYTLRAELVYQLKKALGHIQEFDLEPQFKHVLIDEYQDLNPCDLAIAEAIAAKGATLIASGDDDQSIYGFRFADPSGIRRFTGQFTGSADLALTECRRCDAEILKAALWVAEQDARRVPKELHAAPDHDGGEVRLLRFQNGLNEAVGVASLCRQLIDQGTPPGEILILLRSDHQGALSRPLQHALEARGVPVAASVERRSPLEERHGRKLLSMLRLVANQDDHLAWRTRFEVWGQIGPKTIEPFYEFARQRGIGFSAAVQRFDEFSEIMRPQAVSLLQGIIRYTLSVATQYAPGNPEQKTEEEPTSADLLAMIATIADAEIADEDGRDEVVAFLQEVIESSGATTLEDLFTAMAANREEMEADLEQDRVNLLTMHQAKGLSADAVFIVSAEDEVLPRYETAHNVEDDRRLLYVSMTRARHKLFITYSARRDGPQRHLGRNSGKPQRSLTRFLRHSALRSESGEEFVEPRS